MLTRVSEKRFQFVHICVWVFFLLIVIRLVRLALFENNGLVQLAERQHNLVVEMKPNRGLIFDRNQKELAMNLKSPSIYAVPRLIRNKERSVRRLSAALGKSESFLMDRLSRDKAFIWLERHVNPQKAEAVQGLKDQTIGILYENRRFYPNSELLSNLIGFCNIDNQGIEGIEMTHDRYLRGRSGYRYTKRDALGREVVAFEEKLVPPVHGASITLTIDQYIQYLTERSLDEAFHKWKAKGATAIVMNPNTGEILAMANRPGYDPNHTETRDPEARRNRAITDIYEPGSVFKIVTTTAALAEGKVTLADRFDCEHGEWRPRKSRVIHDVHPYGMLSFPEVLQKSSNIGTVKIALRLGEPGLYQYVKQFGFGSPTGIDLPGEVSGIVHPLNKWSKISIYAIPYGQEVAATALQMVTAVSVIANGGRLMRPYVIQEIRDAEGVTLKKTEPEVRQSVVRPEIAGTMGQILQMVVESGTGTAAKIKGVRVAGKTGTSQKLENGTYSHSKFVGSFIGFAPVERPMLAMIVAIDEPRGAYYGGTVAAPVFQEVIESSLRYLGYIPETIDAGSGPTSADAITGAGRAVKLAGRETAAPIVLQTPR